MKVVALHTDFRIYWPARLCALAKYLADRGICLEVIEIAGAGSPYSFAQKEETKDTILNWHILFPDSRPEDLSGKQIWPILKNKLDEINPDVILSGAIAFPSGALAVRWTNSRKGKRVIVFDDAKINAVRRNPIVNFIKQAVYNGVDAMFYPSEKWIPTGEFWKFDRHQIAFGVDVVDNIFWQTPIKLNSEKFEYFVSVGRQIPKKNFIGVVKAYKQYVEAVGHQKAMRLVLVGNGVEHERIVQLITDAGIDDLVICHDFKNQEDLREIYQNACALIVNSNEEETWGLVINEAMCCGCAIIATIECGATETLVEDGMNGYITQCHNPETLVNAMLKYHNLTKEEKRAMSYSSRAIISDWGLDKFCINCYKLITSILPPPTLQNIYGTRIHERSVFKTQEVITIIQNHHFLMERPISANVIARLSHGA